MRHHKDYKLRIFRKTFLAPSAEHMQCFAIQFEEKSSARSVQADFLIRYTWSHHNASGLKIKAEPAKGTRSLSTMRKTDATWKGRFQSSSELNLPETRDRLLLRKTLFLKAYKIQLGHGRKVNNRQMWCQVEIGTSWRGSRSCFCRSVTFISLVRHSRSPNTSCLEFSKCSPNDWARELSRSVCALRQFTPIKLKELFFKQKD